MANLRHMGTGKKLLVQVLSRGGENVKHWMQKFPTRIEQLKKSSDLPKQNPPLKL